MSGDPFHYFRTGPNGTDGMAVGVNWNTRLIPIGMSGDSFTEEQYRSNLIIALNYAASVKAVVANVSSAQVLLQGPLPANLSSVPGCTNVISNVAKKMDLAQIKDNAEKEIAKIKLDWPDDTGKMVVVKGVVNCPVDLNGKTFSGGSGGAGGAGGGPPDAFDSFANTYDPTSQPFIFVGGLSTLTLNPWIDTACNVNAVDILAPATDFIVLDSDPATGLVENKQGNSLAAPLVAGTIGLMVAADPSLAGQGLLIKEQLLCNAYQDGNSCSQGGRILDAEAAVVNSAACP